MNIQSISIVVPTKGCVNECKFCVSRMHDNPYEDYYNVNGIIKRLKFAANNGVNTLIITGTGEPLQNTKFIERLIYILNNMDHPFPNVEFQTSGVMLTDYEENIDGGTGELGKFYKNVYLLKLLEVNTISLSVSDVFDSKKNLEIMGVPEKLKFDLDELCDFIKNQNFNLRLSLNMTSEYNHTSSQNILNRCKNLGADQITFRKLYHSNDDSQQTNWVKDNSANERIFSDINNYVTKNGTPLYRLPFGPMVYSINGMSTVVDNDCMSKENNESLKYVILRENGKLYCRWDDEGSLIF